MTDENKITINQIIEAICGVDDDIEEDMSYMFASQYDVIDICSAVSKRFNISIDESDINEITDNEDLFEVIEIYLNK